MEHFGVCEAFGKIGRDLDGSARHSTAEMLEQLVVLRFLGGDALDDTRLLDDPAIKGLFGWRGVAHAATFGRRLKSLGMRHNIELQTLVGRLSERVADDDESRLVAIDATVVEAYGEQQGAEVGYHPRKPGRPSYHPLLAVDVATRGVKDGFLRPGSCAGNDGLDGFIAKLAAETEGGLTRTVLRLDKGLTSGHTLDQIEALGGSYVAKAKLDPRLGRAVSGIKHWRAIGGGVFAASMTYQALSWSRSRRMVVIDRNIEPRKASPQIELFDLMEGRFEVMVTNLSLRAENVWRLYNRGTVVEQVIEEVKNDLAAGRIKTAHFWANEALFLTGLIAYNLLNCIRRQALPRGLRTARLKRIGLLLLDLGANVVRHGRQLWLKINRDYPLRTVFYRALAALSPG